MSERTPVTRLLTLTDGPTDRAGRRVRQLEAIRVELDDPHAAVRRHCPHCGGTDHGRPTLVLSSSQSRSWHLSTSSAAGVSAVALAPDPIGFDLADPTVDADPDQADRATTGRYALVNQALERRGHLSRSFHHVWAALEALGKLDGTGLQVDPKRLARLADDARLDLIDVDGVPGAIAVVSRARSARR